MGPTLGACDISGGGLAAVICNSTFDPIMDTLYSRPNTRYLYTRTQTHTHISPYTHTHIYIYAPINNAHRHPPTYRQYLYQKRIFCTS